MPQKKVQEEGVPYQESHIKIVETIAEAATESKLRKRKKIFEDTPPNVRPSSVVQPRTVEIVHHTPPRIVNQAPPVTVSSPLQIQKVFFLCN